MPLWNKSEIDCLTKKQKEMKGLLTELAIDDVMDDIWLCLYLCALSLSFRVYICYCRGVLHVYWGCRIFSGSGN